MPTTRKEDISLVIPTYNRADLIAETIESALAQTRQFREIIVVDDGSTDSTPTVLDSFKEKIRVIRIKNQGVQFARNTGVEACTTELVALSDSDDLIEPHFAEKVGSWMTSNPNSDITYCNFVTFNSRQHYPDKFSTAPSTFFDGAVRDGDFSTEIPELYFKLISFQPLFPTCSMFRKSFYKKIGGYNVSMRGTVGEDSEFARRAISLGKVALCHSTMSRIRKHDKNQSGDCMRMNIGDANILEYCLEHHAGAQKYKDAIVASVEQRRISAFDAAFAKGDFDVANALVRQLRNTPVSLKFNLKRIIAKLPPNFRRIAWRLTQLSFE